MTFPFKDLEGFIEEYNLVLKSAQVKAIFTRAIEHQKEEINSINALLTKLNDLKAASQKEQEEEKANFLLCLELVACALKNELRMLINLKEDDTSSAWNNLIDAQDGVRLAIRNHPFNGDYLLGFANKLYGYEQLLFPKMPFASMGGIIRKSLCSICEYDYGVCDHIKGVSYMGKICNEIIHEISDLEEISLVENPADKRCRVTSFNQGGGLSMTASLIVYLKSKF